MEKLAYHLGRVSGQIVKRASDFQPTDLIPGLVVGALTGASGLASMSPEGQKPENSPIGYGQAALSSLLFPTGSLFHGAYKDKHNVTGPMNDAMSGKTITKNKTRSARNNLTFGSLGGGIAGALGGVALGGALGGQGGSIYGLLPGLALGAVGGGLLGARRYNNWLRDNPQTKPMHRLNREEVTDLRAKEKAKKEKSK